MWRFISMFSRNNSSCFFNWTMSICASLWMPAFTIVQKFPISKFLHASIIFTSNIYLKGQTNDYYKALLLRYFHYSLVHYLHPVCTYFHGPVLWHPQDRVVIPCLLPWLEANRENHQKLKGNIQLHPQASYLKIYNKKKSV